MQDHRSSAWDSLLDCSSPPRVAAVGGGIAGLTWARELRFRGCDPVVFEADARLGGRCSSRSAHVGLFDDGAQCISGATRVAAHAVQPADELAALHPWTVVATPRRTECLWDDEVQLGACGNSVVASQVDRVHRSGVDTARAVAEALTHGSGRSGFSAVDEDLGQQLEEQL